MRISYPVGLRRVEGPRRLDTYVCPSQAGGSSVWASSCPCATIPSHCRQSCGPYIWRESAQPGPSGVRLHGPSRSRGQLAGGVAQRGQPQPTRIVGDWPAGGGGTARRRGCWGAQNGLADHWAETLRHQTLAWPCPTPRGLNEGRSPPSWESGQSWGLRLGAAADWASSRW